MTCEVLKLDGITWFVCGGRRRRPVCKFPGCNDAGTLLCDHETSPGKTCDAAICERHTYRVGEDRDLCLNHRPQGGPRQAAMFGERT